MYKIGEFAKLLNTSIRMLRYYDDIDLLKPDDIDLFTGYRYYSGESVKKNELIVKLKNMFDMASPKIKVAIAGRDKVVVKKIYGAECFVNVLKIVQLDKKMEIKEEECQRIRLPVLKSKPQYFDISKILNK